MQARDTQTGRTPATPIAEQSENAEPPRRVVILAPPNSQSLEVAGPAEVFGMAAMKLREAGRTKKSGYRVEIASAGEDRDLMLRSWSGLQLKADLHYSEVTGPVDTLLIAGGMEVWLADSPALLHWLRDRFKSARRVGSLCTGIFLLAQAGLLDGRRVTTHWYFCQQLAAQYPKVIVDSEPIYIRDGNLSTSAGGTSNFDLALAMVEDDLGTDIALRIARGLVLFVRRPAGQNQFSTSLAFQASVRLPIRELPVFILENLGEPLGIEVLAAKASMSVRNFSRIFRQEYGVTPAAFVSKLRLETAQRLLLESNQSMEEIANKCGLGGVNAMRRAFQETFGMSPSEFRKAGEVAMNS